MYLEILGDDVSVKVTQGMDEVDERVQEVSVKAALPLANEFCYGKLHPDHYVSIKYNDKEVHQVIKDSEVIGFISK